LILLDTDFLIEFLKGASESIEKHKVIQNEEIAISSISVLELQYGELKRDGKFQEEQFFENYLILSFAEQEAKQAAIIRVQLEKQGNRIGLQDEMIAATALTNNAKLLTRNLKHFKRVKGLKTDSW